MEKSLVKMVSIFIQMVPIKEETFKQVKCKVLESLLLLMEDLFTKEIGLMINLMEEESKGMQTVPAMKDSSSME